MATYSMEDYQLRLSYGETTFTLEVVDDQDVVQESFDLMDAERAVTVVVSSSNYVIGYGDPIEDEEEPHKLRMGGGNTQTFSNAALTGIGIMDLRDMGRSGSITVIYNLACGQIRLHGKDKAYPLWIKPADPTCVQVIPATA
jgi:hypothetical protein